jgi:hypothetical protein
LRYIYAELYLEFIALSLIIQRKSRECRCAGNFSQTNEEKKCAKARLTITVSRVKLEHARKFGTKLLFLSGFECFFRAARIVKKNCSAVPIK